MYIVEAYAADGCYVNPNRQEFDTLEEARDYIQAEIEGDFGQWSEDSETAPEGFLPIEAWHGGPEEEGDCGGYGIYKPVTARC